MNSQQQRERFNDGMKAAFVAAYYAGTQAPPQALTPARLAELKRHATTASRLIMHGVATYHEVEAMLSYFDGGFDRYEKMIHHSAAENDQS